ncbi:MAG: hypothetical protein GKS03_04955 [Alphaproteobacteria bacterium]|nr:hypothetical protein [Alphaproteobacteria bacterium]
MLKLPYLLRFLAGSIAAVVVTFGLTVLVMWMNGLIVEDKPSAESLTPCVFGEKASAPPKNPYAKDPIIIDCVPPEDAKPLFTQWFDRILSRRNEDGTRAGSDGG